MHITAAYTVEHTTFDRLGNISVFKLFSEFKILTCIGPVQYTDSLVRCSHQESARVNLKLHWYDGSVPLEPYFAHVWLAAW